MTKTERQKYLEYLKENSKIQNSIQLSDDEDLILALADDIVQKFSQKNLSKEVREELFSDSYKATLYIDMLLRAIEDLSSDESVKKHLIELQTENDPIEYAKKVKLIIQANKSLAPQFMQSVVLAYRKMCGIFAINPDGNILTLAAEVR